jgi:hypothetical protein
MDALDFGCVKGPFSSILRWFRGVRVALANFLPWGSDLLHCVGGLGVLGWP